MKKPSIDVMLDLETTGVSAGCGILAIGACTFDGENKFYQGISLDSCHQYRLIGNADTLRWWEKQPTEVRERAFSGTNPLIATLGTFSDYMQELGKRFDKVYIWGNGADFDLPILGAAYKAVGMKLPWEPYHGRCYRTLKNLPIYKGIEEDPFVGMKHFALDDALHQARHAVKLLRATKGIQYQD